MRDSITYAVIPAKAGLRGQDAEANIRVANGPQGTRQATAWMPEVEQRKEQLPEPRVIQRFLLFYLRRSQAEALDSGLRRNDGTQA